MNEITESRACAVCGCAIEECDHAGWCARHMTDEEISAHWCAKILHNLKEVDDE